MSGICRRLTILSAVAVLLVLGTGLSTGDPPRPTKDKNGNNQAQQALFEAFRCTFLFLAFQAAQAEEACGKTIALLPNSPIGYKFRGFSFLLEHRYERAEMDLREAVRLDPTDPENQAGLAQSMSGQGRFDEAVRRFGIALKISPEDVRYLSARCWALAGQGTHLNDALADCNRALRLAPDSAVAYDNRGVVYIRKGDDNRALHDFSKSLDIEARRSTALFGRGIAEWHLGYLAAAEGDMNLARQIDPDVDDIYVIVGVLAPECAQGQDDCALPKELRRPAKNFRNNVFVSVEKTTH